MYNVYVYTVKSFCYMSITTLSRGNINITVPTFTQPFYISKMNNILILEQYMYTGGQIASVQKLNEKL